MQTHPTPGCPGGCPVALEVGHLQPLITPLGNEVGVQRDAEVLVVHLKQKTNIQLNERVWNCMQFYVTPGLQIRPVFDNLRFLICRTLEFFP